MLGHRHRHRRYIAGDAEQDDTGEQIGRAKRAGREQHPVAEPIEASQDFADHRKNQRHRDGSGPKL